MTEDQKAISLILDLLNATRVPRTLVWIQTEVKNAGFRFEVPSILDMMTDDGLVECQKDRLKIRRYSITPSGREALADL